MTVNEVLDQLERQNFFNADVYIMPPENGESDGDSEDSDDEQESARPLSDHLSAQILKGEGTAEFVDEFGEHDLADDISDTDNPPSDVEDMEDSPDDVDSTTPQPKKRQLRIKLSEPKRTKPSSGDTVEKVPTLLEGAPRSWKKVDLKGSQTDVFNFNGIEHNLPELSPASYFELFWDDDVLRNLQYFSKLYACQKDPTSSFDVNIDELRVVVAILLISGYNMVPRRRLYWSSEQDVRNDMIASAMSRNRFDEILSNLHCADNTDLQSDDRFSKVRPLISSINANYLKHWPVSENLSVDESMIPYYGHHGCKQHIHGKPVRFGFKIWSLNSSNDGYCCQFDPYQGAGSGIRIQKLGLGGSVVVDLVSKLPVNHYHVYADNFFSSLTLVDHLTKSGIGYTGTIRENRTQKCPVMESKKLGKKNRGEFDYRQDIANDLILAKWHDNAVVSLVSNCHGVSPVGNAARWSAKDKKSISVTVPSMIQKYNKFMGGTDLMDRNISNYRVTIRMKKWWWSVFSWILSSSVVNAWCLHRMSKKESLCLLDFTRQIAITYILNHTSRPALGRPLQVPKKVMRREVPDDVRKSCGHYPISTRQNRCKVCQKNTKRACGKCGVNLHDSCFMVFHND